MKGLVFAEFNEMVINTFDDDMLDDIIDDRWYCTIHADKSVEYHPE